MRLFVLLTLSLAVGTAAAQPVAPSLEGARVVLADEAPAPLAPPRAEATPPGRFWPAVVLEAGAVAVGVTMVVAGVAILTDNPGGLLPFTAIGAGSLGLGGVLAGSAAYDLGRVAHGADPWLARVGRAPAGPDERP